MIYSMTAYAREESASGVGTLVWEIRSINHRYLELTLRLPELFRPLEGFVREEVGKEISRGKVEISLHFTPNSDGQSLQLNNALLQQLAKTQAEIAALFPRLTAPSFIEVMKWPGVIQESELHLETLKSQVNTSLNRTLSSLVDNRKREGEAIKTFLLGRLATIETELCKVTECIPEAAQEIRNRVKTRLDELKMGIDVARLEQELAMQLQKTDVSEEFNRLQTHTAEVKRVVIQGGVVGRRLDFLMQELHREANTLGAKSVTQDLSNSVVELKVLIDQMREQVQNIE